MKIKPGLAACIMILVTASSCANRAGGDELSALALYGKPAEIISKITKNGEDYTANYILAGAYRENREPKNALLYYANSCYKSKFNYNLKLYAQPVYAFIKSFSTRSPYYADSVYNIASIFFDYGEHEYVTRFINLIDEDDSLLYRDAVLLKTKSLVKLNRIKEALSALDDLLEQFNDAESVALINIRLGSVYESAQDDNAAAKAYLKVFFAGSETWHQGVAAKRLVFLREQKNVKIERQSLLLLAGALFDTGDVAKAGEYADILLKEKYQAEAAVVKLKVLTVTRYSESVKLLKTMEKDPLYPRILLQHSNLLWDKGNKYNAIMNYMLLASVSDPDIKKRVLTRIVFYLEERNRSEFITYAEQYASSFPNDDQSARFLWLCGRYHVKNRNYEKAASYFNAAVKKFPSADYTAYCRYWLFRTKQAYTQEDGHSKFMGEMCFYHPGSSLTLTTLSTEAGKYDAAELEKKYFSARSSGNSMAMLLYNTLLFIKTGYTPENEKRLNDLDSDIISKYRHFAKLIASPSYKSSYGGILKRLEKYFAAGDINSITREIKAIPGNDSEAQHDLDLAMTTYSSKYSFWNYGTYYAFRLMDDYDLKENLSLLPEGFARTLYPAPFIECTLSQSKKYGINPAVIYSMVKTESNFNHNAVSPVGAIGLMQLMPATASGIARELKIGKYDLADPCTSIKFGTHYIAWLDRYYKGTIEYMVSGYNAGAGNVDKWIKGGTDLDLFAEFTPFIETRDYIFRTKKFIVQYRSLYRW